jgi:hypothetical protein
LTAESGCRRRFAPPGNIKSDVALPACTRLPGKRVELPRTDEPSTRASPLVTTNPTLDGADATQTRQLLVKSAIADCSFANMLVPTGLSLSLLVRLRNAFPSLYEFRVYLMALAKTYQPT